MAKIGYIMVSEFSDTIDEERNWMLTQNCQIVLEDTMAEDLARPKWKHVINLLKPNDELLIAKFSNVLRSIKDLPVLFDFCWKKNIRLISYRDKYDSSEVIFPPVPSLDWLKIIALIPEEINILRDESQRREVLRKLSISNTCNMKRKDKEAVTLNLYTQGLPITEIIKVVGYKSRASIYTILRRHGIDTKKRKK